MPGGQAVFAATTAANQSVLQYRRRPTARPWPTSVTRAGQARAKARAHSHWTLPRVAVVSLPGGLVRRTCDQVRRNSPDPGICEHPHSVVPPGRLPVQQQHHRPTVYTIRSPAAVTIRDLRHAAGRRSSPGGAQGVGGRPAAAATAASSAWSRPSLSITSSPRKLLRRLAANPSQSKATKASPCGRSRSSCAESRSRRASWSPARPPRTGSVRVDVGHHSPVVSVREEGHEPLVSLVGRCAAAASRCPRPISRLHVVGVAVPGHPPDHRVEPGSSPVVPSAHSVRGQVAWRGRARRTTRQMYSRQPMAWRTKTPPRSAGRTSVQ